VWPLSTANAVRVAALGVLLVVLVAEVEVPLHGDLTPLLLAAVQELLQPGAALLPPRPPPGAAADAATATPEDTGRDAVDP
jgi:hypothetical protein